MLENSFATINPKEEDLCYEELFLLRGFNFFSVLYATHPLVQRLRI